MRRDLSRRDFVGMSLAAGFGAATSSAPRLVCARQQECLQ